MDVLDYIITFILTLLILLCVSLLMVRHKLIPTPLEEQIENKERQIVKDFSTSIVPLIRSYFPRVRMVGKTYALVIGLDTYTDSMLPSLPFVRNDVEALSEVLRQSNTVENVELLTGTEASIYNIRKYFSKLSSVVTENDTVFFYFAGHAWSDRNALNKRRNYLCTYDTDFAHLDRTAISFDEIKNIFSEIRTRRMLYIIDACVSEKMLSTVDYDVLEELQSSYSSLITHKNEALMTSNRVGHSYPFIKTDSSQYRSIFTSSLIEALRGGAADSQHVVRVRNLYYYIRQRLHNEHPDEDTTLYQLDPKEDFPILEIDTAS